MRVIASSAMVALGLVLAACADPSGNDDRGFEGEYAAASYNGQPLPGLLAQTQDGTVRTFIVGGKVTNGADLDLYLLSETRSPSGSLLATRADTLRPMGPTDFRELGGGRRELVFVTDLGDHYVLSGSETLTSRLRLDLCGGCATQVVEFWRE